eukprot:3165226-Ditylum_brightwellii.AAC.1
MHTCNCGAAINQHVWVTWAVPEQGPGLELSVSTKLPACSMQSLLSSMNIPKTAWINNITLVSCAQCKNEDYSKVICHETMEHPYQADVVDKA